MSDHKEVLIKVASGTDTQKLCTSIISSYDKEPDTAIILRSIGAGALNQAVKAVILSGSYFSRKGKRVSLVPSFVSVDSNSTTPGKETISAIEFRVDIQRS